VETNLLKKACLHFLGWLDYCRHPNLREDWEGPFNLQQHRQRIFLDLMSQLEFSAIVETGTFRGSTTSFMQEQSGLPVYSVELYPRFYSYARARLKNNRKIHLFCGDSRRALEKLWASNSVPRSGLFFYLDAHWNQSLPLKEEISFIFSHWRDSVVMIDDFQVPDDSGYCFDDYGEVGRLSVELLDGIDSLSLSMWLPALRSENETGAKRGCVVLASDLARTTQLLAVESLRRYG
jgi:hypothetical protein